MKAGIIEKTQTIRELCDLDISELKNIVSNIPQEIWDNETRNRENDFPCFHHTQHILFRMHTDKDDHTKYKDKPLWNLWKSKFMPLIEEAIKPYGYESGVVPKAMLAKLLPGYKIDRHIDAGPRNVHCHKIHIPIQTNSDILFFVKDTGYYLEEGKAYEVNNIVHHHVENNSEIERIHFIFEYYR